MKVLISTDSSCLLNKQVFNNYDINVFPLNVIIDGEEFLDGVTINQEELKVAMRANKKIKTSTPPLGDVIEYFEKLFEKGYDHIIHFTISSKLSSMNQLFNNVADEYFKGKVTVIDSYGLTATMLSYVFLAYEEVKKGTSPEEIKNMVESRKTDNVLVFVPENLTALKNGGRISPAIASFGNLLGIKPFLSLTDGALEKEGMIKNVKKTFTDALSKVLSEHPVEEYDYFLLSFDANEKILEYIKDYAHERLHDYEIIVGDIPINVCAHCGPGTIGLVVSKNINGKSLHEFIK